MSDKICISKNELINKVSKLQLKSEQLHCKAENIYNEASAVQAEADAHKADLEKFQSDINQLQSEADKYYSEAENFQNKAFENQYKAQALQKKAEVDNTVQGAAEKFQCAVKVLQENSAIYSCKAEEIKYKANQLQAEADSIRTEFDIKKKKADEVQDKADSLKSEADIFQAEADSLQTEIISLISADDSNADEIIEKIILTETKRTGFNNYDKQWFYDIKQGVWELWRDSEDFSEDDHSAKLINNLVARNPVCDIHQNGLIGIDFGTKSTIVSKQDGKKNPTLIRIGVGQLNKSAKPHHYENPTVMEFLNLEKFETDYNLKAGRPETCIDDLRVSHPAEKDLKSCENNDFFYSFFYDIKKWCGDTERIERIIDQQGTEKIFPPFVKINNGELNPLELYAYYIGLCINNMHNGIFLDYMLSFPVTYENSVKDKIVESFKNGIRKSLPETILNNKEVMAKFRVQQGISEPAAYAVTALKNYNFEPEDDEKVMYGIFDFGGGTTDFDFGCWRAADDSLREEESYDYVIEHFGSDGDKYLGGENLLELLAFEVFKANAERLQTGKQNGTETENVGFSFSKPKECEEFPGGEMLIASTQEARRNTKQLMEALRPFWENTDSKFPVDDDGAVSVDLFDKNGELQSGFKLYVKKESENIDVDLIKILTERIERGVANFFDAVMLNFSDVAEIQIFLAGNSSKSPVLRKIFDKYIEKQDKKINLFPPLGTEEAVKIQKERGAKINTEVTAPNGKTGVAYGIIEGRNSGKIKVISKIRERTETNFRYNIGIEKRGKFITRLDKNEVIYNKWERFANAGKEFEFYYTSITCAGKMPVDDPSVHLIHEQTEINIDYDIYIRAVSPREIEYILSPENEVPEDNTEGTLIRLDE